MYTRRTFIKSAIAASALPATACRTKPLSSNNPVPRQICVFSKHLQFLDYEIMAQTAAEIGFDGVDLTVRPGGHVLPENVTRDLPRAVKAVERAGLKVPMMTTRITSAGEAHTEEILKTASDSGITHYRMGYWSYDHSLSIMDNLNQYRVEMQKLSALNKKYGIRGAYQNHSGKRVGGPVWDLWHLLKDLDPERIGCQYDVRHATIEGGYSWPLGMRLLSDYIRDTVIKDCIWIEKEGEWHHHSVPLGEGMVDWQRYFNLIKEKNIFGPISMHFEYPLYDKNTDPSPEQRKAQTVQNMQKDLKWLRKELKKVDL